MDGPDSLEPLWCVFWREDRKVHRQVMQSRSAGAIRHLFNVSMRGGNARILRIDRLPVEIIGRVEHPDGGHTDAA